MRFGNTGRARRRKVQRRDDELQQLVDGGRGAQVLMLPAMALAMLRRRAEYTASHHHAVVAHPKGTGIDAVRTAGGGR